MAVNDLPKRFQAAEYQWWRRALMRDRKPVHDEDPQCGLYRWKSKPVEIWTDPDLKQLVCVVDGELYDMLLCRENWISISQDPITVETYRSRVKTGQWPGDSVLAREVGAAVNEAHGAQAVRNVSPNKDGSNAPPEGPELLISQLDELERDAKRMMDKGAAKDQAGADEAAKVASVIEKIEKTVVELHSTAKAPHLAAGRAVDAMWFPLRDRAADLKKRLKAIVITPFLIADQQRRSQESAQLVAQGVEPGAITDTKAKAAGYGRTTALRTRKVAEITDYKVLLEHLYAHPEVRAAVESVANASARAGVALPGMTIKTITSAV